MQTQISVLEDELYIHQEKLEKIEQDMKKQAEEKSIAFDQWETFHDNPAWEQVEMEQRMSSRQYSEIKNIVHTSKRITLDILKSIPEKQVSIGKEVVIMIDEEEEKSFMIWGHQTPIEGRISYDAPLVKAIIWLQEGDDVEFTLSWKERFIEIISVSRWKLNK